MTDIWVPEIYPHLARVGNLLILLQCQHPGPVLHKTARELCILLVYGRAQFHHASNVRHLQLDIVWKFRL